MKIIFICVSIMMVIKMRNEVLINNVLQELDELILKYDLTYTLKNINKPK